MIKTSLAKWVLGVLATSVLSFSLVQADVNIPVINYSQAMNPATWQGVRPGQLPPVLVAKQTVPNPDAYAAPLTQSFFQNRWISVCWISCDQPQPLHPAQMGKDFQLSPQDLANPITLAEANVYYWVSQLFMKMESMGFKPRRHLVVNVNLPSTSSTSGDAQFNNAFFSPGNWTLNFLNSRNTYLAKIKGMPEMLPSFLDPSVAMHEATHSVFEAMIGPILNHEIYGLHEAFADYFAMAVLDSPIIGGVMEPGQGLRTALNNLVYKPGAEVHALGNVVMGALWKIRAISPDKKAADKATLETVRILGSNPFASAGDVVGAHLKALQQIQTGVDPAAVTDIWTKTGLKATPTDVNLQLPMNPPPRDHYTVADIVNIVSPEMAAAHPGLRSSKVTVVNLGVFPASKADLTAWCNFAFTSNRMSIPVWFLFSLKTKGVIAAYTGSGSNLKPINPQDKLGLFVLNKLMENHEDLINLNMNFGSEAMELFQADRSPEPNVGKFFTLSGIVKSPGPAIQFNSHEAQLIDYSRTIQRTAQGEEMANYEPMLIPGFMRMLRGVRSVTLHTVAADFFSSPTLLKMKTPDGVRTLVGYTIVNYTGISSTVMITDEKVGPGPK